MKHKPLLRIVLAVTACLFVFTVFGSTPQITMTTENGYVVIRMAGSGKATIDWSDGESDTYTLSKVSEVSEDFYSRPNFIFSHSYSTATTHTVTITGNLITILDCSSDDRLFLNGLTSLDVSKYPALIWLGCSMTQLTALDVSGCTALKQLSCVGNELTSLDVSGCIALTSLSCNANKLTNLDVSKNIALRDLICHSNQLTADALNTLFGTLHNNTVDDKKTIIIFNNPGTTACNQSIATAKGWTVNTTADIY